MNVKQKGKKKKKKKKKWAGFIQASGSRWHGGELLLMGLYFYFYFLFF